MIRTVQRTAAGADVLPPQVFLIPVAHQRMKNNSYLVVDPASRQAVLIDPAWEMEKIEQSLADCGATLCGILITHAHFDHIHLAKPLADFHNCALWMSALEIADSGFRARQLVAIDETPLRVGGLTVEPILTPGHTPGSLCYLIGDSLFSGDVLFAEGCGICDGMESACAMYASLQVLKSRIAPHVHIYPGHTYLRPPGQRFGEVMHCNMYLHFADQNSFAAYRLRKGQDVRQLLSFR